MTGNKGRVGLIPQERDRRLLSEIAVLQDVDREMAMIIAPFGSGTQAKLRLLELTRSGFLLQYFVGTIHGGRKAIYRLSAKGAALLGIAAGSSQRKTRNHSSGDLFLDHRLKTNAVYIAAKYPTTAALLAKLQPSQLKTVQLQTIHLKTWRTFSEPLSKTVGLIPDGYFAFQLPSGVRAMFLEVDLGTEPLEVWVSKTERYLRYAASGEFTKQFSLAQYRVLVVTTSERRLQNIRTTVARSIDRIFWFATVESICQAGFWSSIWLRPTGDQKQTLL